MRRWLATTTVLVALLSACTSDQDDPPPDADASAGADAAGGEAGTGDCDERLDEGLRAWADAGFSGSVAILRDGRPVCRTGYGAADRETGAENGPDTVFSIGSITKAVTAAAVYALVDDGRLAVDDRAGDLVPGLAGPAADATVGQLLTHTSGLTGSHAVADDEPLDSDAAVAALGRLELASAPGTEALYSNSGYTLLALIVEEVSGTTYRDHVMATVLAGPDGGVVGGFEEGEPAADGPRAVGYDEEGTAAPTGTFAGPYWAVEGNGGVAMTMPALADWAQRLFSGEVVSPEATEAIATPSPAAAADEESDGAEAAGWVVLDAPALGEEALAAAGGGGDTYQNAVVAWVPASRLAVAMASNTPDVSAEEVLQAVGPALVAGTDLPPPPAEEAPVPATGDGGAEGGPVVPGTYTLAGGATVEVGDGEDGATVAARGPEAVRALFPLGDDAGEEDVRDHEALVAELLAGETQEGRGELEALESDLGPIAGVEVLGTTLQDGELRTWVTLDAEEGPAHAWYALDEAGGIGAVELTDGPPTRTLEEVDGGARAVDGPTDGPAVALAFVDGTLTLTGPDGDVTATLAG